MYIDAPLLLDDLAAQRAQREKLVSDIEDLQTTRAAATAHAASMAQQIVTMTQDLAAVTAAH